MSNVTTNPNFHIYLCFGQSNMEGQGEIDKNDTIEDKRFLMMSALDSPSLGHIKGEWYNANPPINHFEKGLSPLNSFGKTLIANLPEEITIGVISIAIGGCDIRLFDKSQYNDYKSTYNEDWFIDKIEGYLGNPYQYLIDLAKQAQKSGVIKGILLHQGETNTGDNQWPLYVKTIYEDILSDLSLNSKEVPLLAGEVVHSDQNGECASMNSIIATLPKTIPSAHIISSAGCTANADNIHFDSEGYRELGRRYAQKMLSLISG